MAGPAEPSGSCIYDYIRQGGNLGIQKARAPGAHPSVSHTLPAPRIAGGCQYSGANSQRMLLSDAQDMDQTLSPKAYDQDIKKRDF